MKNQNLLSFYLYEVEQFITHSFVIYSLLGLTKFSHNPVCNIFTPFLDTRCRRIEERAVIRLLPAYIKRGKLEQLVVLTAIGEETLDGAFRLLKDRLDVRSSERVSTTLVARERASP